MQKLRFFIKAFLACIVGLCANANALNWQSKDFANIKNKEQTMQILIIGANGSVAKITTQGLLQGTKAKCKAVFTQFKSFGKCAKRVSK